jgi:hypothetical protein
VLGGCANNREYRGLASSTGVMVETLKTGTDEFIADQNALNVENAERLDRMMAYAGRAKAASSRQVMSWTVTNSSGPLATYASATQVDAEAIVANMKSRASRSAPLNNAGAGEAYDKASEALGKLAAKPTGLQVLSGLLTYADAINSSYDDLKDKAAEDAKATSEATEAADNQSAPAIVPQGG